MTEFIVGDPVEVLDEGLAMLRRIMPNAPPNHHGWVHEIWDDGTILVELSIGDDNPDEHSQVAPYPPHEVRHRQGERRVQSCYERHE